MLYDYGIKERGYSYDYYNIYDVLKRMYGGNALFFDYVSVLQEKGKQVMNEHLLELVKKEKPDLSISSLYQDEFIPEVLDTLKEHTKSLSYFWDDQWRVNYAVRWAPHFTYISTPDFNGTRKWRERGFNNVIYSPFGCNHYLWAKREIPKEHDVSFIGMYHPYREWVINKLKKAGVNVYVVGANWRKGYVSYEEIINIFNRSKINLNLSNSISPDIRYMFSSLRAFRNVASLIKKTDTKSCEQIKGRHFEIPACGGFQLSYYVEGLEHCYEIGREIAIYTDIDDLVEKTRYYLSNDEEREKIAEAGHRRALSAHTYEKRIRDILDFAGV